MHSSRGEGISASAPPYEGCCLLISLPDEVLQHILSLVPLVSLPSVLFVSRRRFSKLIRERILSLFPLVPTIHLFSITLDGRHFYYASMPRITDNFQNQSWSPTTHQSLHVVTPYRTNYSLVSLGRSIYVIGQYNYLNHLHSRYDTWSKTTSSVAPAPFCCWGYTIAAAVNGKIYAVGIFGRPIGEYNPVANEWRIVTHMSQQMVEIIVVGAGGVLYILNRDRAGLMAGYEPGVGEWVGGMPKGIMPVGSVMCACGTPMGHVYIISLHDVDELLFSRWEGSGEQWIELEAPVVPRSHHFLRLVAMKNEMVVAVVNVLLHHVIPMDGLENMSCCMTWPVGDGADE